METYKGLEVIDIKRVKLEDRTLGSMVRDGEIIAKTLELPWKENKRGISCIINGIYLTTKEAPIPADDPNTEEDESGGRKERPYWHFRYHGIPGRQGVLMHPLGDTKDSLGCVGPASRFIDIYTSQPKFNYQDSKAKLAWLVKQLPDKFYTRFSDK